MGLNEDTMEAWYKSVAYEDAKELLKENLVSTVAAFIMAGYWLKYIRDNKEYEKDGYQSLWECAEKEFGLKVSEASRAMGMNDKYSVDGNTPFMSESYKRYNKSQLQEMLTMTDEQIGQVTPEMTVKDIRQIKSPKEDKVALEKLRSFIHGYVEAEYVGLSRLFPEAAGIDIERLKTAFDGALCESELWMCIMIGDKEAEIVDPETGEAIGRCSADTVAKIFSEEFSCALERKSHKMEPEIKGLMNDPYCAACGMPLNSPGTGHASERCGWCGQGVDWERYIEDFCDVATGIVNTESGEALPGDGEADAEDGLEGIIIEIESGPEDEEPLSMEFNTDELLKELYGFPDDEDGIIDAEYREVGGDAGGTASIEGGAFARKCITGWSKYGACACCGHSGVQCCNQCDEGCNSRCGWIDDPYIPGQEGSGQDDLAAARQLLEEKDKELKQYLACEGIPDRTIFEKRTIVGALANMVRGLEEAEEIAGLVKTEQPEFPLLKNNAQRKEFLEDVEAWGLWYEDANIQARYYKYDFPDGSRCIAVKYRYTCPPWMEGERRCKEKDGSYRDTYYHMIYSEGYKKNHKYEYAKYYTHSTESISTLVEFIREIGKEAARGQQA